MCGKRIKATAIKCTACKAWVHKRCSGVQGALTRVKDGEFGHCFKVFTIIKKK